MNLKVILLILIGIHNPSRAVNLQINEELTLRVGSNSNGESNYTGQPVGILPKGSIVDIPDQYIVRDHSGKVNIDFTLNKWFEEGGHYFQMQNGLNVFHTPIDVIHPKLDPALSGKKLHIALQNIKLKKVSSTLMNVIEDSELLSVLETPDETEAGAICSGVCALSNENIDQNTQDFISKMRDFSENVLSQTVAKETARKAQVLSRNAEYLDSTLRTHCGISQAEIASEIENMIKKHDLPFTCNELMGLLLMESSGRCRALNRANSNKTSDMGLFQINSINFKNDIQNGRAKICSNEEFEKLKEEAKKSEDAIAFWKAQPNPQCISNPMYSLRKGISVLSTNKHFFRNHSGHPDLFRRFILSGYNGGQGNVAKALRDLEIYNSDLQKRLAEGGKDITRSNRGVRKIKEEIRTIDTGIASVNQSLRSLDSNIRTIEDALSRVNEIIPQTEQLAQNKTVAKQDREKQLQDIPIQTYQQITQRREEMLSAINQEAEDNIERTEKLVREWNELNRQDVSLITQQQRILSFLDQHLQNITNQRRQTDPLSRKGKLLASRGQALERFISEVEEEKWPYYMDQLLQIPVINIQEEKPQSKNTANPAEETVPTPQPIETAPIPQPVETAPIQESGFFAKAKKFISVQKQNLSEFYEDLSTKATVVTGSFSEPDWDFHNIISLENQLAEKHNKIRSNRNLQRRDSSLMQEAANIREQLVMARNQRQKDIENILDQNYRDQMSPEEQARAVKIIESEIEMMKLDARREFSQQIDDLKNIYKISEPLRHFFYPKSIMDRISQVNQLKEIQNNLRNTRNAQVSRDVQQKPKNIQREIEKIQQRGNDEDYSVLSFLHEIMTKKHNGRSTYLSSLTNWEKQRTQVDKKRKDLEENGFFQEIKPFLREKRSTSGMHNLSVGPQARFFMESQARNQHNNQNLNQEIRDISRMSVDSNLTSAEINLLQDHISQLEQDLNKLRAEKQQQEQQKQILETDQIEKLDQEDILQKQLEQAQEDLATSKKDLNNWEDIKLFYFAAELKKGITNSGLRSGRSKDNAIINISYVDGLLGTNNQPGFMQTDEAKNLCPRPQNP